MAFGKKRTKAQKQELKETILTGILNIVPAVQVMRENKIPNNTYYRYLDEIAEEFNKNWLSKAQRQVTVFLKRSDNRITELRKKYVKVSDPKLLMMEQDIDNSIQKTKQDLGILEKAPELIKQEVTVVTYGEPLFIKEARAKELKEKKKVEKDG